MIANLEWTKNVVQQNLEQLHMISRCSFLGVDCHELPLTAVSLVCFESLLGIHATILGLPRGSSITLYHSSQGTAAELLSMCVTWLQIPIMVALAWFGNKKK